jgi:hypothetical protein
MSTSVVNKKKASSEALTFLTYLHIPNKNTNFA